MNSFRALMAAVALVTATTASAGEGFFQFRLGASSRADHPTRFVQPLPAVPAPAPLPGEEHVAPSAPHPAPVELYPFVKYKDHDEMHPWAVTTVVCVPDPGRCGHRCRCCAPRMVNVAICVPPNCAPRLDVKRHGREYEYDFGKYAVDVRLKRGYIEVDYQD